MGEKEVRADALIDVGILAVGLSKNPATDYCLEFIEDGLRAKGFMRDRQKLWFGGGVLFG